VKRAAALVLVLTACIASPRPTLAPQPAREPTAAEWAAVLPGRIAAANGYIVGRIASLDEDWQYDDPCGILHIVAHLCDGTVTYRVRVDAAGASKLLWAFTPAYGAFGLYKGEAAVCVWTNRVVWRYQECRQRAAIEGQCPYDAGVPTLTSDLDVLPVADSARVDLLFRAAHP